MKRTIDHLKEIYQDMINHEFLIKTIAQGVHPDHKESVKNLMRYLVLRSHDLRRVHDHLSDIGVSSLRSSESYVLHNLTSAIRLANHVHNGSEWKPISDLKSIKYKKARKILSRNTKRLFGKCNNKPKTRIMVTLPMQAANDPGVIRDFMSSGMQIARIDLSHGDQILWNQMISNIKTVERQLQTSCKIFMDLPGPKIRLGAMPLAKKNRFVRISFGEHLKLSTQIKESEPALYGDNRELVAPTRLCFDNNKIFKYLKVGERVLFDDGKITTKIVHISKHEIELVVTHTLKPKIKLSANKGINFPDSDLQLEALTDIDKQLIPFATKHADIIGFSFVQTVEDIKTLYLEIYRHNSKDIAIVLKIETEQAVNNLPLLLIEALKKEKVGVMIARGDLSVELGPERISEVQDQILWICEAAHVPLIWATQVLENMAKTGLASRAEITDASKSSRAECVMLNKGSYIPETIRLLKNVLKRMEAHNNKKKSVKRQLKIAQGALAQLRTM